MNFDYGFAIIGLAMVLFYLRLAQLRGRKRKEARHMGAGAKSKGKQKSSDKTNIIPDKNQPTYQVTSWWLVGLGGVLMLVGLALRTSDWFPVEYRPYWWGVTTAGVLVFIFCFK